MSKPSMVAAIPGHHTHPCVIKWTGRKGLKVVAVTYCGDTVNAAEGVYQLPNTHDFCPSCLEALK